MCLAVLPNYQIETLSEPLIVYKLCLIGPMSNELISSIRNYRYPVGKLQICRNAFQLATFWSQYKFADSKEAEKVKSLFGDEEILRIKWLHGKYQMITTGFHFYFNIYRISKMDLQDNILVPFKIPAGARIIRGIDDQLGVTDQIIRL